MLTYTRAPAYKHVNSQNSGYEGNELTSSIVRQLMLNSIAKQFPLPSSSYMIMLKLSSSNSSRGFSATELKLNCSSFSVMESSTVVKVKQAVEFREEEELK